MLQELIRTEKTAPITITSANISGFDSKTTGSKTVTVTVDGKTAIFTVNIIPVVAEKDLVKANIIPKTGSSIDMNVLMFGGLLLLLVGLYLTFRRKKAVK